MNIKKMSLVTATAALSGLLTLAGIYYAAADDTSTQNHVTMSMQAAESTGNSNNKTQMMNKDMYTKMMPEDKAYASAVCKIQYKYRNSEEKQFCLDIGQ